MRGGSAVPRVASVALNVLISRAVDRDRVRIQAIALQFCTLSTEVLKQSGRGAPYHVGGIGKAAQALKQRRRAVARRTHNHYHLALC